MKPSPALLPVALVRAGLLALAEPVTQCEAAPLGKAAGRVLAADAVAHSPFPAFDHSAMDGYALGPAPADGDYRVVARSAAGEAPAEPLRPGEAARIFTGAPVPAGAGAVLPQEDAFREGDHVRPARPVAPGQHIRRQGEDVGAGDRVVAAGTLLDGRHLALLAAVGVGDVPVRRRVRVGLLSTGNELVEAGAARGPGGIFDANRPMLAALLARPFVELVDLGMVEDRPERLAHVLADASRRCDALVTTGGTSVGEEDHLLRAMLAAGGRGSLARMAVKPGKPAVFGTVGGMIVCGLPGNPFAALVSALLFARPVTETLAGLAPASPTPEPAIAGFSLRHPPGRLEYVPVRREGRNEDGLAVLHLLGPGGAARLRPLASADGLAVVEARAGDVEPGGPVGFLPFSAVLAL